MGELAFTEVLIVGAGPVGLTLAIDLAWRNVDVAVVEMRPRAAPPEPKCNHVAARTMEIFRRLGLSEKVRNAGLPADYPHDISYRTTFTGQELTRIAIPCRRDRFTRTDGPDGNWPTPEPPHRINQIFLEPILFEHAAAQPRIRIFNRTSVEEVVVEDTGASVTLRDLDTGAIRCLSCRYLIGCDGANSIVRKWMGVAFDGFTYEEKFLCLSTQQPVERGLGDICNVNYMADPEEWLVLLRAPTAWRVLVPAAEATPDEELVSDARKDQVFARLLGTDENITTLHRTIYRVHQRVARTYRDRRVILAGDAAHLNNPLGGFGMNAALHDVRNLCGKLVTILQDNGDDTLLDQYERQRRTVMQEFIQAQSIRNKQAIEMSAGAQMDANEQNLRAIAADPARRRDYLLRQSMYSAVAREQEIA